MICFNPRFDDGGRFVYIPIKPLSAININKGKRYKGIEILNSDRYDLYPACEIIDHRSSASVDATPFKIPRSRTAL